jgi:DNA invertase Pin-like site-specific DNA recombinase
MSLAVPPGSHGKIYVRVSTMHQAGDELPIESQISELQAAVDAAGATAEVVIDAGISGTDLEGRAGLQSIMAAAREDRPGFTWVLAWKYSRFARNMEEALIYRALLKKRGIDLISYKEPVPDGHLGALITHILMAIDEFYAAATAADVLRSQKELTRQGFSAGGRPPVGFRRSVEVIGTKYGGAPLTRVRWVPDPATAPRVVQAFQMAADGATYEDILAATGICSNKSSLATILANTSYRGLRVFNRESRIEGEHGRKRRKNNAEDMVTSEVEAIVPDALFDRVQVRLRTNRDNRLPPQRYAGGYVLTDVLRCQCGGKMAEFGITAAPRGAVALRSRPTNLSNRSWISCGVISCRRRPFSRSSTRSTRRSRLEMSAAVRRWRQARPRSNGSNAKKPTCTPLFARHPPQRCHPYCRPSRTSPRSSPRRTLVWKPFRFARSPSMSATSQSRPRWRNCEASRKTGV